MSRFRTLAIIGFCLTLFVATHSDMAEARGWSLSARYNSSYFHDYHNYGALYSHRPLGYYHGYYGATSYAGTYPTGYYGGWSYYAPYAYTPVAQTTSYGSYYGNYTVPSEYCGSCQTEAESCSTCSETTTTEATCCGATTVYEPGCFSCGHKRGLLGPFCPFKYAKHKHNCGTCGSYGYGSCCGDN